MPVRAGDVCRRGVGQDIEDREELIHAECAGCIDDRGGAPATSPPGRVSPLDQGSGAPCHWPPPPPTVDVVLPCLDEAQALPWVLTRMPPGYRAVVADNGSTDGSADVARAHGALVVDVPQRGFGAACHAGLLAATAEVVCFMDADASLDPQQLPRVAEPVLAGQAELVLGRRRPTTSSAWPLHGRVGNALFARELRRRTGVAVHDLGPMRACRRQPLLELGLTDRRSGYALEMVAAAGAAGWRVAEVDVAYAPRTGRSKVTGSVRGTWTALHDMREVLARAGAR